MDLLQTALSPSPISMSGIISDYSSVWRKISESSCLSKLSRHCSQVTRCHLVGTTLSLLTSHPMILMSHFKMKVNTHFFALGSCIDVGVVYQTLVSLKFGSSSSLLSTLKLFSRLFFFMGIILTLSHQMKMTPVLCLP